MKWKDKIKNFIENVISNIVTEIILGILLGFGTPLLVVWSSLKSLLLYLEERSIPLQYWIIFCGGIFVSILCIICTIIRLVKKRNRPNFPKLVSDVRYETAKTELFFKNREEIICTREVRFEVVCEQLPSIKKQFTWTGSEYKGTTLEKMKGNYTIVDYQRKKPPHGYEVKFDSTKTRGDKIWFKTKTEVEDKSHDMKPFLSHTIKSPTDILEIRVTAPVGLIKNVKFSLFADNLGEIPLSTPKLVEAKNIGNLETYGYEINRPYLLYTYRLDWEFIKV